MNLEKIFLDGVLFDLDVRYWNGQKALRPEDLGLRKEDVPEIFKLGHKLLLPERLVSAFRSLENRGRYVLDRHSFPFPISRVKFVPRKMIEKVEEELAEIRQDFMTSAGEFLNHYYEIREQMLEAYHEHREALEAFYPPLSYLRNRFSFTWSVFSIALPPMELAEAQEIIDQEGIRREAQNEYARRIREQIDRFLNDVVLTLRQETYNICSRIAERIKNGEVITENTMRSLREFIDRFQAMNFVGDQAIDQELSRIRRELLNGRSAVEFRDSESLREQLREALSDLAQEAERYSDINTVTGEYRRRLDLS